MTTATLPEHPKHIEFEELISAYLQCKGLFIERNVIEREVREVLELDIITTDYDSHPPDIRLVEAKSGEWGLSDVFKISGWMHYLSIEEGAFFVPDKKPDKDFYRDKAASLGIDITFVPDPPWDTFTEDGLTAQQTAVDINIWRFSYWVERNLLRRLRHKRDTEREKECYQALLRYYDQINNGTFFAKTIVDRVDQLYRAFRQHPRISAQCGHELQGERFSEEHDDIPRALFDRTFYDCAYTDIQISTYVEHRARLGILKSAVDYKLYMDAGQEEKAESIWRILGHDMRVFNMLPPTFRAGLEELSEHECFQHYPVFWQWFMWFFGGFLLTDFREREYELLSAKTGVSVAQVPTALKAFDILFPRKDGGTWLHSFEPNSKCEVLRLCPVPFMGLGAHYRRVAYTDSREFKDIGVTGPYTLNDLRKWNNLAVEVLRT